MQHFDLDRLHWVCLVVHCHAGDWGRRRASENWTLDSRLSIRERKLDCLDSAIVVPSGVARQLRVTSADEVTWQRILEGFVVAIRLVSGRVVRQVNDRP